MTYWRKIWFLTVKSIGNGTLPNNGHGSLIYVGLYMIALRQASQPFHSPTQTSELLQWLSLWHWSRQTDSSSPRSFIIAVQIPLVHCRLSLHSNLQLLGVPGALAQNALVNSPWHSSSIWQYVAANICAVCKSTNYFWKCLFYVIYHLEKFGRSSYCTIKDYNIQN